MILNLSTHTAEVLLEVVDWMAPRLIEKYRRLPPGAARHQTLAAIQHLGIIKHRIEYCLGYESPFPGPHGWGREFGFRHKPLPPKG